MYYHVNEFEKLNSWRYNWALIKTVMARPSSNCKVQSRPLAREGDTHQQTRNSLKMIKERKRKIGRRPQTDA
jgi:hypothetical protein